MNFKKILLLICVISSAITTGWAQGRKLYAGQTRTRASAAVPISRKIAYPWTWSFGLGTTSYFGQLCEGGDCWGRSNYQVNLGLRYRFTNRISAGVTIRNFRLSASDLDAPVETGRPGRGIVMRTEGYELMAYGTYDFIPTISRFMGNKSDQYNRRNFFVPYAYLGVGMLYFNPKGLDPLTNKYVSVARLITFEEKRNKPYSQITPVVATGLGCRVKISEFFDVGADLTYTTTFTDYLDDLGGNTTYPEGIDQGTQANFQFRTIDNRLANPSYRGLQNQNSAYGGQRRGGEKNLWDGYFLFNVRIDYTMMRPFDFGKQKRHRHFAKGKGTRHHQFQRK